MNGRVAPIAFVPLAELMTSSPAEPDWIWPGYIAHGVITLLAGRPKVGKSTFLFALMAAIDGGAIFCGRSTRRVPVVLLSEERASTVTEKARLASWSASVSILLHHTAYGAGWAQIVEQAAAHVGPGGLVIVDTLADFAGLAADAENNAGAIHAAIRPLQEIAGHGCAVLLVTHQRKAAGEHGEAVRGSNALTAAVDIVVELERALAAIGAHGRVLKAVSRFGTTPDDLVVRLTEHGYEAIGELAGATVAAELDRIAGRLAELGEVTVEELAEDIGLSKPTAKRRLDALLSAGRILRAGGGNKGDPFRWRLLSDSATGIPYERIESAESTAAPPHPGWAVPTFDSTQAAGATRSESNGHPDVTDEDLAELDPQANDPMLKALFDVAKSAGWLPGTGA